MRYMRLVMRRKVEGRGRSRTHQLGYEAVDRGTPPAGAKTRSYCTKAQLTKAWKLRWLGAMDVSGLAVGSAEANEKAASVRS